MAFNRKVLSRALPFPSDIPMHDQWLGIVGEMHFSVHFMKEVLVYHRKHESNASTTGRLTELSLRKQLKHRFSMVKNIIFRRSYAE
jgi:hypothetical protein